LNRLNYQQFLKSEYRIAWVHEPEFKVYTRKNMHLLNREVACDCLDIATIEVDEEHRGKGVFTRFLTLVEEEAEKRHMRYG
jgi:hypothetical protein